MNVYGDLISAGLEKLAAHPTGAGVYLGRVYFNTTDAVPYVTMVLSGKEDLLLRAILLQETQHQPMTLQLDMR